MRARVDPVRLRYYRRRLRAWFREHGRDLPWRHTDDPYRILVSEIMLQQTQVPRVAEVYEEFVAAYPSIGDVAQADLGDVRRITDPWATRRAAATSSASPMRWSSTAPAASRTRCRS